MSENDDKLSWWVVDFTGRLATEQARMKRETLAAPVQDYFDQLMKAEEAELMGRVSKTRAKRERG